MIFSLNLQIKNEIMTDTNRSLNFIEQIIENDLKTGKHQEIYTRFPPEPNGYLHIGHAKSICLNFGLKQKYSGKCNLRFDDTNPTKEELEYVNSIIEDVQWLGFEWDKLCYASDYFDILFDWALMMIKEDKAYVDEQSPELISSQRKSPSEPGIPSPYRDRPIEENLKLFLEMRDGKHAEGAMVLRAKIDMNSPNMHLRDPIMYRIMFKDHDRTGDKWCIYPMYDYAHGQSDYIEGITHSICTLEFEVHRPLYDWFLDQIDTTGKRPRQIEFARLNMSYTIMSKRKLLELVKNKYVESWDDPRMPTISGLRRRGYTPEAIRNFSERVGVAKRENVIDLGLLDFFIREDLNKTAPRVMAVLDPVKVIITNYPEGQNEILTATNNPEDESAGTREISFSKEIFIEREDFMEDAPKKFFRLSPGREVRLRYAYFITCEKVIKDKEGNITEIHCTYDPESKGGKSPDGRKVKATLHWVDANNFFETEVRLYDRLFKTENPDDVEDGKTFFDNLNPDSLVKISGKLEKSLGNAKAGEHFQFERKGYFVVDKNSDSNNPVFNRTVTLKDTWAKISQQK